MYIIGSFAGRAQVNEDGTRYHGPQVLHRAATPR